MDALQAVIAILGVMAVILGVNVTMTMKVLENQTAMNTRLGRLEGRAGVLGEDRAG